MAPKEVDSDSVRQEGEDDDDEEEGENVEEAHELLAGIKESMEQNAGREYALKWDYLSTSLYILYNYFSLNSIYVYICMYVYR